jgi:dihydrofolate synthase/folylpolyglutamate synthase
VGGQVVSLQGLRGRYDDLFLPLYGAHQAENAVVALAAVEAFVGGRSRWTTSSCGRRSPRSPRRAGSRSSAPGRRSCSTRRTTQHGAEATAAALEDSFSLDP